MTRNHLLAFALTIFAANVNAAQITYTALTHPDFAGKATGPDGFWGTADDLVLPGRNTLMAASNFLNADGTFGFQTASWVQENDLVDSYEYLSFSGNGEATGGFFLLNNTPFTTSLSATGTNAGTYDSVLQTFTDDFDVTNSLGFLVRTHSVGGYLFNGQTPSDFVSGGLLTHVEFLVARLPADWEQLAYAAQTYQIFSGANLVGTGVGTAVGFTVVPLPAALPLLLAAVGGLGFSSGRKRGA